MGKKQTDSAPVKTTPKKFDVLDLLVREHYVGEKDAKAARKAVGADGDATSYLLEKDLITKDLIGQALAEKYKLPYADFDVYSIEEKKLNLISKEQAEAFRTIVFRADDQGVLLASDRPSREILEAFKPQFGGRKVGLAFALSSDIDAALSEYRHELQTRFSKIVEQGTRIAPEMVDEVFNDAMDYEASDIHFEPEKEYVGIRFRVDGVLQDAGRISPEIYELIVNRIKVLAQLRIDEHNAVQDGAIRQTIKDQEIDLRVSIAPTVNGEKIVLRLLTLKSKGYNLGSLGLSDKHQSQLTKAGKKPYGIIIVTGPTGSGKTTTLYSLIKLLRSSRINITTIEDPVEYHIEGVNQIQVNQTAGITFAQGLRSIVRQDPDIILVGEIRDKETAEIAINAALTGHLVLSTFHANDSATAIPRLIDMGVEPFLLASTLQLVIAQRLVRVLRDDARMSQIYSQKVLEELVPNSSRFFGSGNQNLYQAKPGVHTATQGFKGRTAVYEMLQINTALRDLILSNPSRDEIWKVAAKNGTATMFDDGVAKVKSGTTTLEELLRVVPVPEA